MSGNLRFWRRAQRPPKEALRTIKGGKLAGFTDVNPQYRLQAMTEIFGPIGLGWYYEIVEMAAIKGAGGEVIASVRIRLYIKDGDEWSKPIEGVGGSKIIMLAKGSLESNDEGFKMALTDALSVAMKQLGIASDVYWGLWDGTKYRESDMAFSPVTEEVSEQPSVPEGETKEEAPLRVVPVDNAENYRKHFVKVIKEKYKGDVPKLGMAIKKTYGKNMTDLTVSEMKDALTRLRDKGLLPENTEI